VNFLAHLQLAGADENLRMGAMLGDFVRGRAALEGFTPGVRAGIQLHRRIDSYTDALPEIAALRAWFPGDFRRYAGIIIDLGIDHELARNWGRWSRQTLEAFDGDVREMLDRRADEVPAELWRFMDYADRRGLFAAYRDRAEILYSLRGIGRRLSRPNPLHRVEDIWNPFESRLRPCFQQAFEKVQSDVAAWLKSKSTTTGS
jgi:acyl carrier protein phosphodiesterase